MVLDTCAMLGLASDKPHLSKATRKLLAAAPVRWISAISTFEIALKHRDGQLDLPLPPLAWIEKLKERYALTEVPVDSALCAAAVALPYHHRDPFDRLIIALALRLAVPVVTVDAKFPAYGVITLA
jgi:PIN domain nuclease of toxin-antitoxin system